MSYGTTKNNIQCSKSTPIFLSSNKHYELRDAIKLINTQFDCLEKVNQTSLHGDYNSYNREDFDASFQDLRMSIIDIQSLLTTLVEDLHSQLYIEDFIIVRNRMEDFIRASEDMVDIRAIISRNIMISCRTTLIKALGDDYHETFSTSDSTSQGVPKKILSAISSVFCKLKKKLNDIKRYHY